MLQKAIALIFCILSSSVVVLGEVTVEEPNVRVGIRSVDPSRPAERSVAQVVEDLNELLEKEPDDSVPGQNFLAKIANNLKAKYNFKDRLRVSGREFNRAGTQSGSVPPHAVVLNTSILAMGAHVGETVLFGPLMISVGESGLLPDVLGHGLAAWGGALINPVPTGVLLIDAATESFCYVALFLAKSKTLQKGAYRVEAAMVDVSGKIAKRLGAGAVMRALGNSSSGMDLVRRAMEAHENSVVEIDSNEVGFRINDRSGSPLAELHFESVENGDSKLSSFDLYPTSETVDGRKELSEQLKIFGGNISGVRDAVLKPEALVAGKHAQEKKLAGLRSFQLEGSSVLLKKRWTLKPEIKGPATRAIASAVDGASQILEAVNSTCFRALGIINGETFPARD